MNRNVESFRAQPPEKLIEALRNGHAFKPDVFAKRTKGMGQSVSQIDEAEKASKIWNDHVQSTCEIAEDFLSMGIAKQQVNFLLQDLCPLTEVITATDWSNFYALRCEVKEDGTPVARPEVYKTAVAIRYAIETSTPQPLQHGWLHLPMLTEEELGHLCAARKEITPGGAGMDSVERQWIYISAGRCARVSYGYFKWWEEDTAVSFARAGKLLKAGHMSPFEQQARCFSKHRWNAIQEMTSTLENYMSVGMPDGIPGLSATEISEMVRQLQYSGNLHGWVPARKSFPNEHDYSLIQKELS
jgi:hypothetical protein